MYKQIIFTITPNRNLIPISTPLVIYMRDEKITHSPLSGFNAYFFNSVKSLENSVNLLINIEIFIVTLTFHI